MTAMSCSAARARRQRRTASARTSGNHELSPPLAIRGCRFGTTLAQSPPNVGPGGAFPDPPWYVGGGRGLRSPLCLGRLLTPFEARPDRRRFASSGLTFLPWLSFCFFFFAFRLLSLFFRSFPFRASSGKRASGKERAPWPGNVARLQQPWRARRGVLCPEISWPPDSRGPRVAASVSC